MSGARQVQVLGPMYGGMSATTEAAVTLPFVLRTETVEVDAANKLVRVVEEAPGRVKARCPHFGVCGGCQYQMIEYEDQLEVKRSVLRSELEKFKLEIPVDIPAHSSRSYAYRNRVRFRIARVGDELRLGYNVRETTKFVAIEECPISAPILLDTAKKLLALAATNSDAAHWLNAAHELELFTNHDLTRVQFTLFCAPRTKAPQGSFQRMVSALQQVAPCVSGAGAAAFDPRTGPTGRELDAFGQPGLSYRVGDETYWITRGGFFQVNRFLIDSLVHLVTEARHGALAWDLFAGVGLFSRVLARSFARVTAVEANPIAANDLKAAMAKLGKQHAVMEATTLAFLRQALLQRDRPDLIVLDPPRAGAGTEACELLNRLGAPQIVYVSCDPTTLARDLAVLQSRYKITALHLVDLFPQTFHLETVAVLDRIS